MKLVLLKGSALELQLKQISKGHINAEEIVLASGAAMAGLKQKSIPYFTR